MKGECKMKYLVFPVKESELAFCNCACKGGDGNCNCNGNPGGYSKNNTATA